MPQPLYSGTSDNHKHPIFMALRRYPQSDRVILIRNIFMVIRKDNIGYCPHFNGSVAKHPPNHLF